MPRGQEEAAGELNPGALTLAASAGIASGDSVPCGDVHAPDVVVDLDSPSDDRVQPFDLGFVHAERAVRTVRRRRYPHIRHTPVPKPRCSLSPKVSFERSDDRMFDPHEYRKLIVSIGRPFTLTAAGNDDGGNVHAENQGNYCCPARPFQQEDLSGQMIFMNAPLIRWRTF